MSTNIIWLTKYKRAGWPRVVQQQAKVAIKVKIAPKLANANRAVLLLSALTSI